MSTHEGNSNRREWRAVMACSGFGAVVDTARMTGRVVSQGRDERNRTDSRLGGSNHRTLTGGDHLRRNGRVRPTRVCEWRSVPGGRLVP